MGLEAEEPAKPGQSPLRGTQFAVCCYVCYKRFLSSSRGDELKSYERVTKPAGYRLQVKKCVAAA